MGMHRLNHSFTAGELSPLMNARKDFERYKNGCRKLYNMVCATQGPATRRPGTEFIYDLTDLGMDISDPLLREIPFIFSETQTYAMIFFMHTDGDPRLVFGYTDSNGDAGLLYDASVPGIVILTLAGWDITTFDWAQSADDMYFALGTESPKIIRRTGHYTWSLVNPGYDTPSPAHVDWSNTYGWPERVTFHQQRLVFASNTLNRQKIWMSEAGDFSNFTASGTTAEQPVSYSLDSGTQNRIQWAMSGKSLHVGTLGDEWTVTGGDIVAITPEHKLALKQTNNGSKPIKPLVVGNTIVFVERHGRVVNEFVYDYTYDSYKTSDLVVLSPHLTDHYSITDWAYQQTPDNIIWSVREDGHLLGITYQRQHKVVGWHDHETQGEFKTVTSIPGNTREDDIWVVVKRIVDEDTKYYVEKFKDMFVGTKASESEFLDCALSYTSPGETVTGLDHLEGMAVGVLADGTVHPPLTVSSGQITLNSDAYTDVLVGLNYTSEVWPLVSDVQTENGTAMGRMQRVTNVDIDIYKSLGMIIGRFDEEDGEHVEDIPFRRPWDNTGEEVPLFTGIVHIDFPEGFERDSVYFIRQEQPLPLTVRGVIDTIEVYE